MICKIVRTLAHLNEYVLHAAYCVSSVGHRPKSFSLACLELLSVSHVEWMNRILICTRSVFYFILVEITIFAVITI